MESKKPDVQDLAPIKFPKRPPQDIVAEYLHSHTINNMVRKYPEWDVPRSDAAAELVARKRELYEAELCFSAKRREAVERRQNLNDMWKDLEDREEALRSNFIKFNKFVKENQEKKERAERMIAEDSALAQKRSDEIYELTMKYEFMCGIRSQMEKNIKMHHIYEEYLMAFSDAFPSFRTIESTLDRYEALAEARKVLADRQEKDLSALEDAKANMLKMTEESSLALMGLHNILADLESRYESAKNKALHWETLVTRVKNILIERLQDLQGIRQSAWTVYLAMCKRKEIEASLGEDDIENQLLFIKTTIGELKKITKIALKRASKENAERQEENTHKK